MGVVVRFSLVVVAVARDRAAVCAFGFSRTELAGRMWK
jgi:hypothetical protein